MRTLFLSLVIIGFVLALSNSSEAIKEKSLVLYCPFEEGSGKETLDKTGNNKPGILQGGAKWEKGQIGNAISFNGKDAYIEMPDNDILDPQNITVEMWVKPNGFAGDPVLFSHSQNDAGWYVQATIAGKVWFCIPEPGGDHCHLTINLTLEIGKFQHLAITYDKKNIKYHLNGELKDTIPEATLVQNRVGPLRFGTWGQLGWWFDGILDEVAIYSRVLTEEEIKQDMKEGILADVSPLSKLTTTWGSIKTKNFH